MNQKKSEVWINIVGIIGILYGIFYAFFGLGGATYSHKVYSNNEKPSEILKCIKFKSAVED